MQVQPAACATEPLGRVGNAERRFTDGGRALGRQALSFDRIGVVFDGDEHHTDPAAWRRFDALHGRLDIDERVKVPLEAVVRLLGHLAVHAMGQASSWAVTRERLDVAAARANVLLATGHSVEDGARHDANMHELVHRLRHLKGQAT